jgi:hypothetical protein
MIILLVIAVAAVVAPVIGVVLLSLAIRREDAALSLSGRPSGAMQAAARRLVGFHGDGIAGAGRGGTGVRPGTGPAGWPELGGDPGFTGDMGLTGDPLAGDPRDLPLAARR